jgi:hypothetical protein
LLRLHLPKSKDFPRDAQFSAVRVNFRRLERQEWWLWAAAIVITLLLTTGLASFLLPSAGFHQEFYSQTLLPQALRALVGLIFLFDLYTIYQHLLIHRIRKQLVEREELFHLISENAADNDRDRGHKWEADFQQPFLSKGVGVFARRIAGLLCIRTNSPR